MAVLALSLGEVAARATLFGRDALQHPARYTNLLLQPADMLEIDAEGFRLRPNLDVFYKGARFTTNEHGFRGPSVRVEKPAGVTRIAVLGRSNTMGHGVGDEDPWPRQLERLLNATGERRFEVLNLAMSGYVLSTMLHEYERRGRRFGADLVLIEAYASDLRAQPQAWPSPFDEVVPSGATLLGYSMLAHVLRNLGALIELGGWDLPRAAPERGDARVGSGTARAESGVRAVSPMEPSAEDPRRLLLSFMRRRHDQGVRVALVRLDPIGRPEQLDWRERAARIRAMWTERVPHAYWLDTASNGVPACDRRDWIFFGDHHPSASCHASYARALRDPVLELLGGARLGEAARDLETARVHSALRMHVAPIDESERAADGVTSDPWWSEAGMPRPPGAHD